jgi:hypothetical protein
MNDSKSLDVLFYVTFELTVSLCAWLVSGRRQAVNANHVQASHCQFWNRQQHHEAAPTLPSCL